MSITTIARRFAFGIKQGIQEEYDRFWDEYQKQGNRKNYYYALSGAGWSDYNLKLKYVIDTTVGTGWDIRNIFRFLNANNNDDDGNPILFDYSKIKDMFNLSGATICTGIFQSSRIKNVDIDLSNATAIASAFSCDTNGIIESIRLKVTSKCTTDDLGFAYNSRTKKIEFYDSEIAVNMGTSQYNGTRAMANIDGESIMSIVNALSANTTGKYATFNATAIAKAEANNEFYPFSTFDEFVASTGKADNWTITYV